MLGPPLPPSLPPGSAGVCILYMSAFDDVLWPLLLLLLLLSFFGGGGCFLHSVDSVIRVGRWEEERGLCEWFLHVVQSLLSTVLSLFFSSRRQIYVSNGGTGFEIDFLLNLRPMPPTPNSFYSPSSPKFTFGRQSEREREIFSDAYFYHSTLSPMTLLSGWSQGGGFGWGWWGSCPCPPHTLVLRLKEGGMVMV